MKDGRSRTATTAFAVVGALLLVYGTGVLFDSRPVGARDDPAHCGNAFWAGRDTEDAATLCGMHQALGRTVGGGAVLLAAAALIYAWRRRASAPP